MTSTRSFEDATNSNSDKCQAQINVAIRRQSSSYLGLLVIGCRGTPSIMQVCATSMYHDTCLLRTSYLNNPTYEV
jgi:hypothetical protein